MVPMVSCEVQSFRRKMREEKPVVAIEILKPQPAGARRDLQIRELELIMYVKAVEDKEFNRYNLKKELLTKAELIL